MNQEAFKSELRTFNLRPIGSMNDDTMTPAEFQGAIQNLQPSQEKAALEFVKGWLSADNGQVHELNRLRHYLVHFYVRYPNPAPLELGTSQGVAR